jgi:hypothetical protein
MEALDRRLSKMDQSLKLLLEELKKHPDTRLNSRPDENSWSVLQVMHHLMRSEELSLRYLQKKLQYTDSFKASGIAHFFRYRLLRFYLRSPFKFQAPKAVDSEFLIQESTFWEMARRWSSQREELYGFLREIPPELHRKVVYKHPFAGRLNILSMVDFFQEHFNRHEKQIHRLLD